MSKFDKKRSSKRRAIDDKVISKAKKYVKFSEEQEEGKPADVDYDSVPTIKMDLAPLVKLRKPRHSALAKQEGSSLANPEKVTHKEGPGTSSIKKKSKKKHKRKRETVPQISTPESEDKHTTEALEFLMKWSNNKSEWKFEKLKQVWLLKHALQSSFIDEEHFKTLLNFVGSIKGQARRGLQSEMDAVVRNYEKNFADKEETEQNVEEMEKYERARQIMQMLTDD